MRTQWIVSGIIVILGASLLTACSFCNPPVNKRKLTKDECRQFNWYNYGKMDGARARPKSNLSQESFVCEQYGFSADPGAYDRGYQVGFRRYCTPEFAYQLGCQGKANLTQCPNDTYESVQYGWKLGLQRFCTPERAYHQGLQGREYLLICPRDACSGNLYRAYQKGQKRYVQKQKLQAELQRINQELSCLSREACTFEKAGRFQKSDHLSNEINYLKREKHQVEQHLLSLEQLVD